MPTVRDLMQRDVVTVGPEVTVRELTRILSEGGISGVPVVTDAGEVLGVVSTSDVVRLASEEREAGMTLTGLGQWSPMSLAAMETEAEDFDGNGYPPDGYEADESDALSAFFLPEDSPIMAPDWSRSPDAGPMDEMTVSDIMTPVAFSLPAGADVRELSNFLVRGRIHRAVVVEDGRLQGIVTTMDVLRALSEGKL